MTMQQPATSFVLDVADGLTTVEDSNSMLRMIVGNTIGAHGACASAVVTLDRSGRVHAGCSDGRISFTTDIFIEIGRASAASGGVVHIDDTRMPGDRWTQWARSARRQGARGVRAHPFRIDRRRSGALVVCTPDRWSDPRCTAPTRDASFTQIFADAAGAALASGELLDRRRAQSRALRALAVCGGAPRTSPMFNTDRRSS